MLQGVVDGLFGDAEVQPYGHSCQHVVHVIVADKLRLHLVHLARCALPAHLQHRLAGRYVTPADGLP